MICLIACIAETGTNYFIYILWSSEENIHRNSKLVDDVYCIVHARLIEEAINMLIIYAVI
jgi:hypothetical protein